MDEVPSLDVDSNGNSTEERSPILSKHTTALQQLQDYWSEDEQDFDGEFKPFLTPSTCSTHLPLDISMISPTFPSSISSSLSSTLTDNTRTFSEAKRTADSSLTIGMVDLVFDGMPGLNFLCLDYASDENMDLAESANPSPAPLPLIDHIHLFASEATDSPSDHASTISQTSHQSQETPSQSSHSNRAIAPKPRIPSHRSFQHFLDLEAKDDDEDASIDEDDTLEEDGFIDDTMVTLHADLVPFDEVVTGPTRNAAFLEHLEQVYAHPSVADDIMSENSMDDRSGDALLTLNNCATDYVEKFSPEINHLPGDWALFRVECKAGSEYEILFDIMHAPHIESEVRSAFFNPSVGNHLYIEGSISRRHKSPLLDFLHAHSDVQSSTLRYLPSDDHRSSLWVRPQNDQVFARGTWVKILSPDTYRGDVGLVRGLRANPGRLSVLVTLVPRTFREDDLETMTRPNLELMLDEDLETAGAVKYSSRSGDYYTYGSEVYQSGLIMLLFAPASLAVAHTISGENHRLFIESKHAFVLERRHSIPVPEHWSFHEGDEVRVISEAPHHSGPLRYGLVRSVLRRCCEVEFVVDGGFKELIAIPMNLLVKEVTPGDYVKVVAGIHDELCGLVGEKNGRVVGIIPDNSYTVSVWVDANSVVKSNQIIPLSHRKSLWMDLKVVVTNADFNKQLKGIIKRVWADGHGLIRILVYVPTSDCSFELDYTQVVEEGSYKSLDRLALDSGISLVDDYGIDRTLHLMKTGRQPWIGVRVLIIHGHYHGYTGTVRDVNLYRINHNNLYASGLRLTLEIDVMTTTAANPRIQLDYDLVRELRTHAPLHNVIRPSWNQSIFMPNSRYKPTKFIPVQIPTTVLPSRPSTPLIDPDSLKAMYEFVGSWYPAVDVHEIPSPHHNPPSPDQQSHFLAHKNLLGIAIRVDVDGGPYDTLKTKSAERYVIPTPYSNGSFSTVVFRVDRPKIKVGDVFLDGSVLFKHRNRPKPSTEKRLMVVIGGFEEHIGKFVRRLYYFYKGSMEDDSKWFRLVVVYFSDGEEIITDEEIELHPGNVEYVRETSDMRRKSTEQLAERRQFLAHSAPELRRS
ncbi:hypothetical protein C8R42DRAFT_727377 [Lentinula raphanica]|nr:hypothetical protein C8R42DRAFT_727377 [Lentinula raphanica]